MGGSPVREQKSAGRPREFDVDAVLIALMELFWRRGYEGTSLADIVEATGLKKGSLYAAFGDKRDMYLKALAHYDAQRVELVVAKLRGAGAPAEALTSFSRNPSKRPRPRR